MTAGDFADRRYLVTGVLSPDSIAFHVAAALQQAGAEVVLTSFGRALRSTRLAARLLPGDAEVLELDAARAEDFPALAAQLSERVGSLDGIVHAVAWAAPEAMGGGFLTAPASPIEAGFRVSVTSFQQLVRALSPLLAGAVGGGSVVALTVDSSRALPGYDWMGVYKAALEATTRYLAVYGGAQGIRANVVAAGPLETLSSAGVATFAELAEFYEANAPLGWDRTDPSQVVGPILFLLSPWARSVSGQVLHADGGTHAVLGGVVGRDRLAELAGRPLA